MTNGLELKPEENRRYMALCAGHGTRTGTGIFPASSNNQKISQKELIEVKCLLKLQWRNIDVQKKTGLSEYIVRMAFLGHYDHILTRK